MPGWIPLYSTSSGAAFAGVLAALVITVSVQIAARFGRQRRHSLSLKASPPTLVMLLLAAYLYIVLDGIPVSSEEIDGLVSLLDPGGDRATREAAATAVATRYLTASAQGFAVAGTVLALGALMTLFVVAAWIFDNTQGTGDDLDATDTSGASEGDARQAEAWALAAFEVTAWTVALILLLGYKVGAEIDRAAGSTDAELAWAWVTAHAAALVAPLLVVTVGGRWRPLLRGVDVLGNTVKRWAAPTTVIVLTMALPGATTQFTVATTMVQDVPLAWFTGVSGFYYSVCSAFLLWLLQSRQRERPRENVPDDTVIPSSKHSRAARAGEHGRRRLKASTTSPLGSAAPATPIRAEEPGARPGDPAQ